MTTVWILGFAAYAVSLSAVFLGINALFWIDYFPAPERSAFYLDLARLPAVVAAGLWVATALVWRRRPNDR